MKIRTRLTLTLSLTVLAAISVLGWLIFWMTERFHKKEFFNRLEERVSITEQILLEKDEVVSQAVRERFLQTLDDESEYAVTLGTGGADTLKRIFNEAVAQKILAQPDCRFEHQGKQGVSKHYELPGGKYAVIVTASDVFGKTKLSNLRRLLLIGNAICVLLLVAVSWHSVRRVLSPLENKIHKASRISANRLNLRLEIGKKDDELAELAQAFNLMLDRLQAAFEAQRAFVRNASHEIRNPLTAIIGEADLVLSKDRSSGEYRQALFAIQKEAQRLEDLTRQLLDLEKAEALTSLSELEEVPLHLCLLETLSNFSSARIQLTLPENKQEFLVPGSLALLQTALNNLIDNALKYSGDKPIQVELSEESDWYRILVADQGIGIPANEMPNIYQPLHRGANARIAPGHGIGLPLAKKIIELHKGTIEISSTSGVGTLATVLLPKLS